MTEMWHHGETRDGILRVTINRQNKPVNALSRAVLQELRELVQLIHRDSSIRGVLFQSGKPGTFIAGADITEFEDLTGEAAAKEASQFGQTVFRELEELTKPTVALISGACLGGGLEFALACRYRIADTATKTKIGLPEVQLGLIPGWGGTVRLSKLIGLIEALPLILTGKQLNGLRARSKGVVHDAVPTEALDTVGEKILKAHFEHGSGTRLFRKSNKPGWQKAIQNSGLVKKYALNKAEQQVRKETRGHYPAPLAIIETLRRGLSLSTKQKYDLEATTISKLGGNAVTKECIRLFFLSEEAKKIPEEVGADFDSKEIRQVAVLGAGAMGAGIALLFAKKGIDVRLKDIKAEFVANGVATVRTLLAKDVQRKKLTKIEARDAEDRISPTVDYRGLKQADIVVEAVLEVMDIKRQVFQELAEATGPETVLATNTSSLLVSDIAEGIAHPERIVGLHFFNPPHRMPLVEIIRTEHTSPEALAKAFAAVTRLGKTPVIVGDCAGFLVNRLLGPYMNEAGFLLAEVSDPLELEKAAVDFGMPMGPLALSDLVGLEVAAHVAENLHEAYGDRMKPAPVWGLLKELRESENVKPKLFDRSGTQLQPAVMKSVLKMRGDAGLMGTRSISAEEIIERLVYPIVNEAAMCLQEGIVRRSEDVDLAMVFGTGFAPFRGGPMQYALSIGLDRVVSSMEAMSSTHPHLAPSEALKQFAAQGNFQVHSVEPAAT
ncbi:MAG: 3-hydroxyacyl-CoA dehydrogenase NAD-binding domain-containing protein [Planctomycetota bacterium]|nr:3-hydroxyacyl-CoA dehydrogenase NAD-binding domain-containing protein [Planctomycetota bacterium]MDA1248936.1 3-hydroxyacyl-CoA dehydrogenase NAD-binding domain-containing protein [Planctomycetota bacterium]